MTTLAGYYLNPHRTQFDGSTYAGENCTPTSGANGANAATRGRVNKTGAGVRAKVRRSEETSPVNPGWSLQDLDLAMRRTIDPGTGRSVPFDIRTGQGWGAVAGLHYAGYYVVVQGDSDRFSDSTCSGAFNGDHCIGVHPASRTLPSGAQQWWADDPICKIGRWEYATTIMRYAIKYYAGVKFGVFTTKVARTSSTPSGVTLRYGGAKFGPKIMTIRVPAGQRANVRRRPTTDSVKIDSYPNGTHWMAYQITNTGQLLAGSRRWYGNKNGDYWLHVTAF